MKNLYPKSTGAIFKPCAVILIAFVAIIYGCRKDLSKPGDSASVTITNPKIATAKTWYETMYSKPGAKARTQNTNAVGDDFDLSQFFNPDWADANNYTRFNDDVIEMPMDAASAIGLKVKTAPQSSSRSSVLILKRGDNYKAYVMTIVGYPEYLNGDTSKLTNNSYGKRDANFSGMVYYTTPQGEFVNGYTYKNGVIKGQLMDEANTPSRQTTQSIKDNKLDIVEVCTEWYQRVPNDEGSGYHWIWIGESDCHNEVVETPDPGDPNPPTDPGSGSPGDPTAPDQPDCPPQGAVQKIKDGKVVYTLKVMLRDPGDGGFPPPTPPDDPCTIPVPKPKIINKVQDPCLKAMVDAIINSNVKGDVNSMIQNIFGNPSNIDLTFTDQSALSKPTFDAEAVPSFDANNKLISDEIHLRASVLANSSKEFIAATIMHEALHAYMDSQGINLDQHAVMAENYLNTMASDLKNMFPGMANDVAYSLAWGGLEGTYLYNNPGQLNCPGYQPEINTLLRAHTYDGKTYGHGCN